MNQKFVNNCKKNKMEENIVNNRKINKMEEKEGYK